MTWTVEDVGGHAMRVRAGVGHGAEIVWIHGMGESAVGFEPIIRHPALAGFGHTLIELPGYGDAPWPVAPDGLEALADRLAAWLVARGRPAVVGHSLGGVLAILVAERGATRAIVAADSNLTIGDCTFSARAAAYALDDFIAHGFAALQADVRAAGLHGYHAALQTASPACFHRHARELVAVSATDTLAPRFARLAIPSCFIAGVPDGICAESRAQLDRHAARWIGLTPAGHWLHHDQPDAFAAAVARALC